VKKLLIYKCAECNNGKIVKFNEKKLICNSCSKKYEYSKSYVSITKNNFLKKQKWNAWDSKKVQLMGDSYYRRSIGKLPEKEASKSFAKLILKNNILKNNESILDYGCATGHFYKSFKRIIPFDFKYYGIDAVKSFLKLGVKAYKEDKNVNFIHGDILNIPVKGKTFDLSSVNLFHFFPDIYQCLKESKRVTKKYIIWRTPIADLNHYVKIFHKNDFKVNTPLALNSDHNEEHTINIFYNIEYLKKIFKSLNLKMVYFKKDNDFKSFDNTKLKGFELGGTKTINRTQLDGIMLMNWHYIILKVN
jgi:ubiquinone/menaquinone biosynthesis C-methylase UbiE